MPAARSWTARPAVTAAACTLISKHAFQPFFLHAQPVCRFVHRAFANCTLCCCGNVMRSTAHPLALVEYADVHNAYPLHSFPFALRAMHRCAA